MTLLHRLLYTTMLLSSLAHWGCQTDANEVQQADETERANVIAQQNAARTFLNTFVEADDASRRALVQALKPTPQDVMAVFPDTAIQRRVQQHCDTLYSAVGQWWRYRSEYNAVLLWSANAADFEAAHPEAFAFPSSFLRVVPYIKPHIVMHRFKFVKQGNPSGSAYTGLTYVNERWVLFPEVWRAVQL